MLRRAWKHMDKSGDTVDKIFKRMDDNTSNVSASPSKPHSQRELTRESLEPFSPILGAAVAARLATQH